VTRVSVNVPDVVTGPPDQINMGVVDPSAALTLVTVPDPAPVVAIVMFCPEGVTEIPVPATRVMAPVSPFRDVTADELLTPSNG
jgi:hypothetical protein